MSHYRHYEVAWKLHRGESDVRAQRSIHLNTLELAEDEAKRVAGRNDLFIQDEDGFPFVDDVKILRVDTTVTTETVEQVLAVLDKEGPA